MSHEARRRLSTGSEPLDRILGGGFPVHSLNILMGHPGTGKTVLAEQMLFHNAGIGRPVLYLTTLSEPLPKMLTYVQGFSFFDAERMQSDVVYDDLGEALVEEGVDVLVQRIRKAIRELGPRMIVVDSFKVLHDLEPSAPRIRRVLAELAGILAAYDTTTFLVGEYSTDDIALRPEFAVADGILQLTREGTGKEDRRALRVLKLRGSVYREGGHAFRITADGLRVFPRLVTPPVPERYEPLAERVGTGLPRLDDRLGGGLWRGSTTLVVGREGSGKTTLALAFAFHAVRSGEHALFLNFQEDPSQLARTIQTMGEDAGALLERGLYLEYASPVELQIDSLVDTVFRHIEEHGVTRVVIDAAGDLALAAGDDHRVQDYLYSLIQHFSTRHVTALLTLEELASTRARRSTARARFASMTDAIIRLDIELEGRPRRTLRIVKARGIDHPLAASEMEIRSGGIRLVEGGDRRG